jgi:hypothetical protein
MFLHNVAKAYCIGIGIRDDSGILEATPVNTDGHYERIRAILATFSDGRINDAGGTQANDLTDSQLKLSSLLLVHADMFSIATNRAMYS